MKEGSFFYNARNVKRMVMGLYLFLVVLVAVDFIYPKHPFFAWEEYHVFYGVYGFISYTTIVFGSTILRKLLNRKEDYYD